ncbi:hypothetical protein HDU93_005670, partial [Gonapodya sp. JEL0774]
MNEDRMTSDEIDVDALPERDSTSGHEDHGSSMAGSEQANDSHDEALLDTDKVREEEEDRRIAVTSKIVVDEVIYTTTTSSTPRTLPGGVAYVICTRNMSEEQKQSILVDQV